MVLRCRGCGRLVSEWAARCPDCRRGTGDAESVLVDASPAAFRSDGNFVDTSFEAATAPSDTRARVAPRPRGGRRRSLISAAIVAVLVAGAILGVTVASSNQPGAPRGRVLSFSNTGVVVSAPNGTRITPQPLLASAAARKLIVAADGRYLATTDGEVIAVHGETFTDTGVGLKFPGRASGWRAVDFADEDRAIVVENQGNNGTAQVEAVSLATRQAAPLGTADPSGIAGDPEAAGVFVAVTEPPLALPAGTPPGDAAALVPTSAAANTEEVVTDDRVGLRDAGSPVVVLATAAQLVKDLGVRVPITVQLTLKPDRNGDKVGVVVTPVSTGTASPSWAGIVILDRYGHLASAAMSPNGIGGGPAWSPQGTSLVYLTTAGGRAWVTLWHLGHPPKARPGPTVATTPGETFNNWCLWAIDGNGYLCTVTSQPGQATVPWVIGNHGNGPLLQASGPAVPLAWLPGSAP